MEKMIFCDYCGKEQTELEYIVGQCNNCDPFEDEDKLEQAFGEPMWNNEL